MAVKLNPYLNFKTETRAALEFYQRVFGGQLDVTTFKEGGMSTDPAHDQLVMHAHLESGPITLMASDTPPGMDVKAGTNVSLSLSGDDEKTLRGYWEKLSAGGTVAMPLEKAPWGDTFGMCTDKFGMQWMVNITGS